MPRAITTDMAVLAASQASLAAVDRLSRAIYQEHMLNWLAKRLVQRGFDAMNAGDPTWAMSMMADDARLVFPGTSTWGGEYRGKAAMERFARRCIAQGIKYRVHDVLIKGPPWNMTLVYMISDEARDASGHIIYQNRAMEYCKLRWFKIVDAEVFEDTERTAAYDRSVMSIASSARS